jgi:hypothetical protein
MVDGGTAPLPTHRADEMGRGRHRPRPDSDFPLAQRAPRLSACPPVRLVYWQTHSPRRPTDHIQAAALAFATGSKMS